MLACKIYLITFAPRLGYAETIKRDGRVVDCDGLENR
jgi:hypothetical protein